MRIEEKKVFCDVDVNWMVERDMKKLSLVKRSEERIE